MRRLNEIFRTLRSRYLATLNRTGRSAKLGHFEGYIDSVKTENGQMHVSGWYNGAALELVANGVVTSLPRQIFRDDVPQQGNQKLGFSIPISAATSVSIRLIDDQKTVDINLFRWRDKAESIIKTMLFLPMLLAKNPMTIFRFLILNDRQAAGQLERILLKMPNSEQPKTFDMSIFDGKQNTGKPLGDVTIVLPVYNSFSLLKECLARVMTHTAHPFKLIIIEDCSSDPAIRPWLRDWVGIQKNNITLLENDQNLGFIGSVNRGIAAAKGNHVVLLNSDAFVPDGWLSRLMAPIYLNPKTASTTPLSNNAEILSLPVICKENHIPEGAVDRIDNIAKALNGHAPSVEIPTGIGFCMALNKSYLQKVPSFDRRFGKGYGEEVDWCQKTRQKGGKHMAVTNLFVHHVGGESFGAEKQARLAKNNAVITRLYPRYDQLVQEFAKNDPLHSTRVALAVATIDIGQPVPVYLAHSMGGGTEIYLQNRIKSGLKNGQGAIIIRGDLNAGLRFELYSHAGKTSVMVKNFAEVSRLLAPIRQRELIYACLVGAQNPVKSMQGFLDNLMSSDDSFCLQLHDFFPICPSYNLLDTNGKFCAVPTQDRCRTCYQSKALRADTSQPNIAAWRDSWSKILKKATRIEAFSDNSAQIFIKAYPALKSKVQVHPHQLPARPGKVAPIASNQLVVGVLGNIGFNKGAEFLQKSAGSAAGKLIVFGNLDQKFSHKNLQVNGPYLLKDLARLARSNKVNCWLIPSIWPETFSFTTHEALATGLPVFSFDLGAQAETLKKANNGFVIPQDPENLFANIKSCLNKNLAHQLVS